MEFRDCLNLAEFKYPLVLCAHTEAVGVKYDNPCTVLSPMLALLVIAHTLGSVSKHNGAVFSNHCKLS